MVVVNNYAVRSCPVYSRVWMFQRTALVLPRRDGLFVGGVNVTSLAYLRRGLQPRFGWPYLALLDHSQEYHP